jgi:hypothetical protein
MLGIYVLWAKSPCSELTVLVDVQIRTSPGSSVSWAKSPCSELTVLVDVQIRTGMLLDWNLRRSAHSLLTQSRRETLRCP